MCWGSIWTQNNSLPLSEENSDADLNGDGNNALKMIRSKSGQRIILDDTEGAEKIQILNPDGTSRIELNAEDESINLISEVDVTISSETSVSITAEEMSIELEGDLTGECENFGIEASGDTSISGDGGIVLEGQGHSPELILKIKGENNELQTQKNIGRVLQRVLRSP